MARGKELSLDMRDLIIKYYIKGVKVSDIASKVNKKWSTVKSIINHYLKTGSIKPKQKLGSKRKTTAREDRKILNLAQTNRRQTLGEIGNRVREDFGIQISDKTVQRRLHDSGIHGRIARKKPLLKDRHVKARLSWCRNKENWTASQWSKVLWSDESKFCLIGSAGVQRVWRRPGEELKNQCLLPTVKHGGGK